MKTAPPSPPDTPALPHIVVGICSHRAAFERRQAVRETWMRNVPPTVRCLFFVGQGDAIPDAGKDVVELPVSDDYDHLPQKVFTFFAFVCCTRGAAWVFKCDDDTYVDLCRLMELTHPGVDLVGDMSLRRRNAPSGGAGYLIAGGLLTRFLQDPLPSATGA